MRGAKACVPGKHTCIYRKSLLPPSALDYCRSYDEKFVPSAGEADTSTAMKTVTRAGLLPLLDHSVLIEQKSLKNNFERTKIQITQQIEEYKAMELALESKRGLIASLGDGMVDMAGRQPLD